MISKAAAEQFIDFYKQVLQLKKTVRKGWAERKVPEPESVAEHSFGVSILALFFSRDSGLDTEKLIKTALIHDLCEAITSDITPNDNVAPEEKQKREYDAAVSVLGQMDESGELIELWKDFEYERTPEGKLVKELDRLEMVMQALDYEYTNNMRLDEFYEFAGKKLNTPALKKIFNEIKNLRTGTVEGD